MNYYSVYIIVLKIANDPKNKNLVKLISKGNCSMGMSTLDGLYLYNI